jgi:CRP/FNR family transcriptional regulator, cyclic AMP receptor protein
LGIITRSFGCADDTARAIAARATMRKFPHRAVIANAGDPDPDAWLILSGQAQALAFGPKGQFILVHMFEPGDLFGEAAGLSLTTIASEITARGPVDAGQFSAVNFIGLMETHGCVALAVTRGLVARLRQTTQRLVEGATLSANGRIHAELLRQARAGDALRIRPAPILSSFALQVQSTRETVSRAISALEKGGIIRRDADALTVVAPHRLEELIY